MNPFHRDASPIPSDKLQRRKLIEWLQGHPAWGEEPLIEGFDDCVDVDFFPYLNPTTGLVDPDDANNTVLAIRVEAGPNSTHDLRLDYWAPTLEIALLGLAVRLAYYYDESGNDRGRRHLSCPHTSYDLEQYCEVCGLIRNYWNYWAQGSETTISNSLHELGARR